MKTKPQKLLWLEIYAKKVFGQFFKKSFPCLSPIEFVLFLYQYLQNYCFNDYLTIYLIFIIYLLYFCKEMSRRSKEIAEDVKTIIMDHKNKGHSIKKIAKLVNIHKSTIQDVITRFPERGTHATAQRTGRPRKTTSADDRKICREVEKNRKLSANEIRNRLPESVAQSISLQTIRNRIREKGLRGCTARRTPCVSKLNMKKRELWAKKYISQPKTFWNSVLWSDECKFNLFGSDGHQKVWRKPHEEYKLKCTLPTVKHGGGSIMVWGSMAASGVGNLVFIDGIMDRYVYKNILDENVLQSAEKLGIVDEFWFQQDNDPKHKSRYAMNYFDEACLECIDWVAQSPAMNPIEHLWLMVKFKLKNKKASNIAERKEQIMQVWSQISPEFTRKLFDSMPKRLKKLIEVKGAPTGY